MISSFEKSAVGFATINIFASDGISSVNVLTSPTSKFSDSSFVFAPSTAISLCPFIRYAFCCVSLDTYFNAEVILFSTLSDVYCPVCAFTPYNSVIVYVLNLSPPSTMTEFDCRLLPSVTYFLPKVGLDVILIFVTLIFSFAAAYLSSTVRILPSCSDSPARMYISTGVS